MANNEEACLSEKTSHVEQGGGVALEGNADDRAVPRGARTTLLAIAAIAFIFFIGFVVAYGVYGERLTSGVDATCARAAFEAGKKMEALGNYDRAVALFRHAMAGHFQDKERQYMCGRSIGELYVRMGRYAEAVEAYKKLPPEALDSAGALTGYVSALHHDSRYGEAERLGKEWLRKAEACADVQQRVWANHTLGLICHETGRTRDALPYFRAVRTIDPENRANLDIARVLSQAGEYREALEHVDILLAHAAPGLLHTEATELRSQILEASKRP